MTDLNARLDEIAKELVHNISTLDDRTTEAEIVEARHEARAALDKAIAEATEELRKVLVDDSYAITFQSMGQYRTALLNILEEIKNETQGSYGRAT